MTIEERAQELWEETRWLTERKNRIDSYAQALRDQIEDCAKIADSVRAEWAAYIGNDIYTLDFQLTARAKAVSASEIAESIRALAVESPPLEARIAKACDLLEDEDALAEMEAKQ